MLADVRAILERNEADLGRPFWELGADPDSAGAFLADLNRCGQHMQHVAGLVGNEFDIQRLNTYAETQGALRDLHNYVGQVVAQGRGSVSNTQHARRLLATAREALERLMALLGVGAGQNEATRPAPAGEDKPPPPRRPPNAVEEAPPTAATDRETDRPASRSPDTAARPSQALTPLELAERLAQGFNKTELKDLAFKLGFVVDDLPENVTRFGMARSLVEYADRRGQLPALVEQAEQERRHLFS
jgi:hypothetical protein